jgi:hypothetical protein
MADEGVTSLLAGWQEFRRDVLCISDEELAVMHADDREFVHQFRCAYYLGAAVQATMIAKTQGHKIDAPEAAEFLTLPSNGRRAMPL